MAEKPMRYFNGRCPLTQGRGHTHAYICARSVAEAVRLGKEAFGEMMFSTHELNEYWSKDCWGTKAEEILGPQTEPGVFICFDDGLFFKFVGGQRFP